VHAPVANGSTGRPAAIDVADLTRSLPLGAESIPILRGVSFCIEPGSWVAITGPSGSGKSTLLGILAGLDRPSGGRVSLDGIDITRMHETELAQLRNAKIGVVFQSFNLIPALTALENVEAPLYVGQHRREARPRARRMLERVGLGHRLQHQPHQLSGGEQQRVAVARALVTAPSIVVADEPTGNLDSKNGSQILDLFSQFHADGNLTLVVVTHDPEVAARAGRRLHLIDGRLASPDSAA